MKELQEYRDNYESLMAYFGDKRLLRIKDVAKYCGRDERTVKELYDIQKGGITIPTLARRMCQ